MLFVKLSPKQAASYAYACGKLQNILSKMMKARKTMEEVAASSFNKSFAKCVYLIASESRQFENEIHAQIGSFNCSELNTFANETLTRTDDKYDNASSASRVDFICNYLEENYIKSYRQLLKDKHLSASLKRLMNNQLQVFLSSLTQLRLFHEVETTVN